MFFLALRIAGAAVQSGSDTASAIGRGVSDTITVVNEAGLPEKPSLQVGTVGCGEVWNVVGDVVS